MASSMVSYCDSEFHRITVDPLKKKNVAKRKVNESPQRSWVVPISRIPTTQFQTVNASIAANPREYQNMILLITPLKRRLIFHW